MLLSYENIAHFLMDKGLIPLDSIIRGEFSVRDQSSRNANFAINQEYEHSYFVKQVRSNDQEKLETLRIEATCYWLACNDDAYQALHAFLPRYFDYDYLHHILILELLTNVQNLHTYYHSIDIFPIIVAEKLAALLSSYHTHETGVFKSKKSFSLFKKRKPWVFTITEEYLTDWIKNPSIGNAEKQSLNLILSNQEFMENLNQMREDWDIKSLIHGDVKFPNFLINRNYGEALDIRLIDWELADIGDPLWDVAAVFQSYLTMWVTSETGLEYQKNENFTVVRLEQIQPSIDAFWNQYVNLVGWKESESQQHLNKTVGYTALKLVNTCLESIQGVKNMSIYSAKILQLSFNLLRNPDEAIIKVLGIQTFSTNHEATTIS